MENLKYRVYEYEFHRGTINAEISLRINNVYGEATVEENTIRFWFQCFRSGNFDLQKKPRGRPETGDGGSKSIATNGGELAGCEVTDAKPSSCSRAKAKAHGGIAEINAP
ncbi:hypothetical protein EVAR_93172_1 [Eumeta japonica]|uniref:Mos1 transposase HTH domain-containing protein n=1 Tax=Eumeta variegata TaxID=151549 RepID=A0A4C1TFE6_EUMVA|nr:hypothetical protein EVAR_93172_1 [Eumeta japonica]